MTVELPAGTWAVSFFDHLYDTAPKQAVWSWGTLLDEMVEPRSVERKDSVRLWSPCAYPDGATREAGGVDFVTMLVLDIDEVPADKVTTCFQELWRHFNGFARVQHTTFRHDWKKPKFRLILPLKEPVPGVLWGLAWDHAARHLPGWLTPDTKCRDASRMFYLPAAPYTPDHRVPCVYVDPGQALISFDLEALAAQKDQQVAKKLERAQRQQKRLSQPRSLPPAQAQRVALSRFRLPEVRRRVADLLGVHIGRDRHGNDIAEKALCPECRRNGVWWSIDIVKYTSAFCQHRDSCAWHGSLLTLLESYGTSL